MAFYFNLRVIEWAFYVFQSLWSRMSINILVGTLAVLLNGGVTADPQTSKFNKHTVKKTSTTITR